MYANKLEAIPFNSIIQLSFDINQSVPTTLNDKSNPIGYSLNY